MSHVSVYMALKEISFLPQLLPKCDSVTCMNVETIWTLRGRMGGMQVLRRGGGGAVLSVITTQMVQGPFLLTDVRAHVG